MLCSCTLEWISVNHTNHNTHSYPVYYMGQNLQNSNPASPCIISIAVLWLTSNTPMVLILVATHAMLINWCSDGAIKLSVSCLPPLGSVTSLLLVFPSVTSLDMTNAVSPVSGVAQVNSTGVFALTFLDWGVSDSIMTAWITIENGYSNHVWLFCSYLYIILCCGPFGNLDHFKAC